MSVLGIDLGLKRSGLAVSGPEGLSVRLLDNLVAKNQKDAVDKILVLVKLYDVTAVVIGRPPALNKNSETIAMRASSLAEVLTAAAFSDEGLSGLDVILWDESYSSKKGMSDLVASGVPRKKRQEKLDAAAAAVLVEEYLSSRMSRTC